MILKKALFWDFDGTLVYKNGSIWSNSMYAALADINYKIDIEEIRQHLRKGYSWGTPEISYIENTGQRWWDKLFDHLDIFYKEHDVSKDDAEKSNSLFMHKILDFRNYTLYENAAIILHQCADMGYKNYVLSNNYPELPLIIKDLGLAEYFTDYVISANIGYEKPRTEIFQYALNIAGYPDICYMIGDNPIADIQGGQSAGMKTILVHKDGVSNADYMCKNLSEVPLLFKA